MNGTVLEADIGKLGQKYFVAELDCEWIRSSDRRDQEPELSDDLDPDVVIEMSLLRARAHIEEREELKGGLFPDFVRALGRVDDISEACDRADSDGRLGVGGERDQSGENFHPGQGVVGTIWNQSSGLV